MPRWLRLIWKRSQNVETERQLEPSLIAATRKYSHPARNPILLVQGDPGTGKSVALRQVARAYAESIETNTSEDSPTPIHVTLRDFRPEDDQNPTIDDLQNYILRYIRQDVHRNAYDIIKKYYDTLRIVFILDSFDEIPAILSAPEANKSVQQYALLIERFIASNSNRSCVLSSRTYHNPRGFTWPRLTLKPLSSTKQNEMVAKAGLPASVRNDILDGIHEPSADISEQCKDPLFLAVLIRNMREKGKFPSTSHELLQDYTKQLFSSHEQEIWNDYRVDRLILEAEVDNIAFTMFIMDLGLEPTVESVKGALSARGITVSENFDNHLKALSYLGLIRTATTTSAPSRTMSFVHRRFQEYFATKVVQEDPSLVTPFELLTNDSWRETAVVLCQNPKDQNSLHSLLKEADRLLQPTIDQLQPPIISPALFCDQLEAVENDLACRISPATPKAFSWLWPARHILSILQDGFIRGSRPGTELVQQTVDRIVVSATTTGTYWDQQAALNVAGPTSERVMNRVLREAFASNIEVLRDVAYQQVARLGRVSPTVSSYIRKTLLDLFDLGTISREKRATITHLSRLDNAEEFVSVVNYLTVIYKVDVALHVALFVLTVAALWRSFEDALALVMFVGAVLVGLSYAPYRLWRLRRARRLRMYRTTPGDLGWRGWRGTLASSGPSVWNGFIGYVVFWCRLVTATFLVILALGASAVVGLRVQLVVTAVLALYVAAWAPASFRSARMGRCLDVVTRWLSPMAEAYWAFMSLVRVMWPVKWRILLSLALYFGTWAVLVWGVVSISLPYWLQVIWSFAAAVVLVSLVVFLIISAAYHFLAGRMAEGMWSDWLEVRPKEIDHVAFAAHFVKFFRWPDRTYVVRFCGLVRDQEMLLCTDNAIELLARLLVAVGEEDRSGSGARVERKLGWRGRVWRGLGRQPRVALRGDVQVSLVGDLSVSGRELRHLGAPLAHELVSLFDQLIDRRGAERGERR